MQPGGEVGGGDKSDVEGEAQLGLCDSNDSQLKSPAFSSAV